MSTKYPAPKIVELNYCKLRINYNQLNAKLLVTQNTSLLVSTIISFVNIRTSESERDIKAASSDLRVKLLYLMIFSRLDDVIK